MEQLLARFELSAACSAAIPAAMRVSNGIRTRDILDHNQVLYQLSYTHHGPLRQWRLTNDSVSVTPLGNLRGFLPSGYVASGKGSGGVSIQRLCMGRQNPTGVTLRCGNRNPRSSSVGSSAGSVGGS